MHHRLIPVETVNNIKNITGNKNMHTQNNNHSKNMHPPELSGPLYHLHKQILHVDERIRHSGNTNLNRLLRPQPLLALPALVSTGILIWQRQLNHITMMAGIFIVFSIGYMLATLLRRLVTRETLWLITDQRFIIVERMFFGDSIEGFALQQIGSICHSIKADGTQDLRLTYASKGNFRCRRNFTSHRLPHIIPAQNLPQLLREACAASAGSAQWQRGFNTAKPPQTGIGDVSAMTNDLPLWAGLQERIKAEITTGEVVVWQSRPDPVFIRGLEPWRPFVTLIVIGAWIIPVSITSILEIINRADWCNYPPEPLYGLFFCIGGLLLAFKTIQHHQQKRMRKVYLVTNQRALIINVSSGSETRIHSYLPHQLEAMAICNQVGNSADLVFEHILISDGDGDEISHPLGFLACGQVRQAREQILRHLQPGSVVAQQDWGN